MSEELLINVNVSGEDNLTNIDSSLNKVTESSKKTTNAFTAMRKEVRDAKATMLSAAEGSDEYNAAMQRAAAAADKMRDMNDKIKASQKDVGVVAKNVAGAMSGLAGAFSTVEGVVGLFGIQSEDTTKAILKIQQVMAVTSGIAQMADAFDSIKDLFNAVKINIMAMITAKQAETVATVENTAANVAEAGAIGATGVAATVSAKAILASLGPMALVAAAVGLLVTGVMKLIETVTKVPDEIKIDVEMDEEVGKKLATNIQKAHQFALDYNSAVRDGNKARINELTEVGVKEFNLHKNQLKMIADNVDNWRTAFDDYLIMAKRAYKEEILIKQAAEADAAVDTHISKKTSLMDERQRIISKLRSENVSEARINMANSGKFWGKVLMGDQADELNYLNELSKQINEFDEKARLLVIEQRKADERLALFEKNNPRPKQTQTDINLGKEKKEPTKKEQTLKKGVIKSEFVPEVAPVVEDVKKLKDSSNEFEQINKDVTDSEKNKQIELDLLRSKEGKSVGEQLDIERNFYQKNLENATKQLKTATDLKNNLETLYNEEVGKLNQKIDAYNTSYQKEIKINTDYKNKIAANKQEMQNIETQFAEAKNKADKDALQSRYNKLNEENVINENELKLSENRLKGLETAKNKIDTGTKAVEEIGSKVKDAGQQVIDANNKIVESNVNLANNSKDTWANMIKNVESYSDTAKGAFDAMANLNQAEIDSNNAKYDANAEMIEKSNMSEDEKTAALKKNEQERYKENLKSFEAQKKWQIASVLASSASSIAKTWEGYSSMGIPGAILAGIQTAVIAANTIAQIKTIKAQRMDAPSESSTSESSASSSAATVYQALTPTSNSLTSSQENLNMMSAASQKNIETIVKVSDINLVQNKVTVRDSNSSY